MRRTIGLLTLAFAMLAAPAVSQAQFSISVSIAPPILPVYAQPVIPADGYIWTPGYWAWDGGDYYWVPGTWVLPPEAGLLWTPGYWGWSDGLYVFHPGYWADHVGFYGGVNYGYGYIGFGYFGGRWNRGRFEYNQSVNNINRATIHNTYSQPVAGGGPRSRVSFNGGAGGINARATPAELAVGAGPHVAPTALQVQHEHGAAGNRQFHFSANHGAPAVAATARPGAFTGPGVVRAGPSRPPQGAPVAHAAGPQQAAPGPGFRAPPSPHVAASQPAPHAAPPPHAAPAPHPEPNGHHDEKHP